MMSRPRATDRPTPSQLALLDRVADEGAVLPSELAQDLVTLTNIQVCLFRRWLSQSFRGYLTITEAGQDARKRAIR